jgi:hypothetical protein
MPSLFLLEIDVGGQDFATCLPVPPPSLTEARPEHLINTPRAFSSR